MDKLIKLLNEYDKINEYINNRFRNEYWCLDREFGWATVESSCLKVISKDYGFIKRLVDNDKINIDKYYEFMTNENIDISNACWELDMDKEFYYELLMILAVQENSIEFLISILK